MMPQNPLLGDIDAPPLASTSSRSEPPTQQKKKRARPSAGQSKEDKTTADKDRSSSGGVVEEMMGRKRVADLLHDIDPHATLEPEVEGALMELADEFIESVTSFSCLLARHRGSTTLEAKDIRLHLEKTWDLRVPGFTHPEDVRPLKRRALSETHRHRLDVANRAGEKKSRGKS